MDLLSSIRKSGSRGGVNFSWDDVSTSQHRENYLGHSLMAPVGRWQKGRDLSWYAKGDDKNAVAGETAEEKKARERKEEIRRIKEAEEDALARALGLPVADRGLTGSNAITVGEVNRVVKEERIGEDADGGDESGGLGKGRGFGDFVGKVLDMQDSEFVMAQEGGLVGKDRKREAKRQDRITSRERKPMHHRHRSRSGERRRHRSRSGERHRHRHRHDDRDERRPRSRSIDRRERRYRSRSSDHRGRIDREHRGGRRSERSRRSRSPPARDSRNHRDRDLDRR